MTIERIALSETPSFYRDFVLRSRPVVITDFLPPESMTRARELGRASEQPTSPGQVAPSLLFDERRLLELLDEAGGQTVFMRAPDDLRALFCRRLALPFEDDAVSELWAGRAGGQTLFHYDLDMRANVLVQLFGHKRIAIADPGQTQKLEPFLHGNRPQFSSRLLAAHDEQDRRRFLALIEARETTLGPGEALFIPALYWHELDYVDTTLSITLRLGRDPSIVWLASTVARLWPAEIALVQGIAARCCSEPEPRARLAELRAAFEAACERDEDNPRFLEVLHRLHADLCPGRFTRSYSERDAPYFEARSARRPHATAASRWDGTSVPWLAPGYEAVEVLERRRRGAEFRILSCASTVIAHVAAPPEASKAIRSLLRSLAHRGTATIDELAETTGLDGAQLVELIRGWSRREWIVHRPSATKTTTS